MYASFYDYLRCRPRFADIHVNLRDGTIGTFPCQRERARQSQQFILRTNPARVGASRL